MILNLFVSGTQIASSGDGKLGIADLKIFYKTGGFCIRDCGTAVVVVPQSILATLPYTVIESCDCESNKDFEMRII